MRIKNFLLLFPFLIVLLSCGGGKVTTFQKVQDDFYNNLQGNMNRLVELRTGLFVQYQENVKKNTYNIWGFNDNNDSMVLYSVLAGNPLKDGYWIYHHQFLSQLSDAPVYSAFEKIEQIERDSFVGTFYESPENFSFEEIKAKNFGEDIKFEKLKPKGEIITYVKETNVKFNGFSKPYKNPRRDMNNYRQDIYVLMPKESTFRSTYLDDISKENPNKTKSVLIEHLVRLNPDNTPFFNEED